MKVDFEVELTLTKCPEKGVSMKPITFNISAQGIGERVVINVEPLCDCDCEKENTNVTLIPLTLVLKLNFNLNLTSKG